VSLLSNHHFGLYPNSSQMNTDQLNYDHGFKKVESFIKRLTSAHLSSYAGKIIWIHNSYICHTIKTDKCSIWKIIKSNCAHLSNRDIDEFADSVISNECRQINTDKNEVLALTSTPDGVYVSIIEAK